MNIQHQFNNEINEKRFTLKRNNEDTNPDIIRKKKDRDQQENGQKSPVKSSREMYDILMKGTTKKQKDRNRDRDREQNSKGKWR